MKVLKLTDNENDPAAATGLTRFIYHSDYSGSVTIERSINGVLAEIDIPFWQLKEFVASHVRAQRVDAIVSASSDEVLGLNIRVSGPGK